MISFVIWWYPPSNTGICISRFESFTTYYLQTDIARFWFLGIGYTNVVAAIYIYAFSMNYLYIKANKGNLSKELLSKRGVISAYLVLEALEILILVLWVLIEDPKGEEVIVDEVKEMNISINFSKIKWTTINQCTMKYGVMDLVQYIYFCVISVFGCYVIFKYWKKESPEDTRWMLMALYNQLLVFIQLIIITSILDLNDEQLYVITVPSFLFAEANIVCSFFLPKFLQVMCFIIINILETQAL
jgi:hypothetical protein